MSGCQILRRNLGAKVIQEPEVDGKTCKCYYAPRYWEGEGSSKHWFQFRINPKNQCTKKGCKTVFYTWGNLFLKKMHYPGDNEKMEASKLLERDENYNFQCAEGMPEGIILPSPNSKIAELRLAIARATDEEERARLQALLDELLKDKEVEIFAYDLEGGWGPEHHADVSNGGDLHSYYLKPCKSNYGNMVTELHDIMELCGPGSIEEGTMKEGKLRWQYQPEMDWGPERVCGETTIEPEKCKMLQEEVARDGWELLSFRLKPCRVRSKELEIMDLSTILAEDHCGKPVLGISLLPVKVSAAKKFDSEAPDDELEFPCP